MHSEAGIIGGLLPDIWSKTVRMLPAPLEPLWR